METPNVTQQALKVSESSECCSGTLYRRTHLRIWPPPPPSRPPHLLPLRCRQVGVGVWARLLLSLPPAQMQSRLHSLVEPVKQDPSTQKLKKKLFIRTKNIKFLGGNSLYQATKQHLNNSSALKNETKAGCLSASG